MVDVRTLKRQHEEIGEIIDGLRSSLKAVDIESSAFEIAQRISLLSGKLKIHLMTEDTYMYPNMLQSNDVKLKKIAEEYVEEMGHLSSEFIRYKDRFNTKIKILGDTKEFIKETQRILAVLEGRVKKENTYLYPLFQ